MHGRRRLRYGSLPLGGVAFGPIGADTDLVHAGELRRAAGDVHGVGEACGQKYSSVSLRGYVHSAAEVLNVLSAKDPLQDRGYTGTPSCTSLGIILRSLCFTLLVM